MLKLEPGAKGGFDAGTSAKVGSKPAGASPYGAMDMAGNVNEWVADWFAPKYDTAQTRDPKGPAEGTERVFRGGSWNELATAARTSIRWKVTPSMALNEQGFRCARSSGSD